jgi:hypothetical protein
MALVLFIAIALTYLLVFHITARPHARHARTEDENHRRLWRSSVSSAMRGALCGYLAGVATLFLGFLWIGFDNEKRGLQDWIAGTYVIRV